MAISNVNIGSGANDGSGDPLRTAFQKINDNLWYLEATKGTGGGGGGGSPVDLSSYATITYVGSQLTSGLANVTGVNLNALNNALANVYAVNLDNLNNALANVTSVNLDRLNNALANITSINLDSLNNALANVNAVSLNNLNNALANLSLVNLTNLSNALAQIDFSLLGNVSNLVSTVAANAPGKVGIVSNLNTPGTVTGQSVLNNSDNKLYVWNGSAWTSASAMFTPNANSISGVQVVDSLPGTGNFEGRQVLSANALYIYSGGAWKSATEAFTPTANSLTAVQIFTGASLPATTAADSGRTLFWTNESNLYINVGGSWNNYNSYIQGSGTPTLGAGSVNSAAIQNDAITADKIVSGAIIVGKIAAGAVRATELAADAVTSDKILANAVVAGKVAAGAIKAEQIEAGAITSAKIAADAIVAGKIAAGAISATEIAAGAIGADQIAANAIVSSKIAAANIFAINLAANAVTANAIEAFAVTADKIRANAIYSYHLTANSVSANAIETNSITSALIKANAITAVQLAALSVYTDALQANVITSDKIRANAITAREIAAFAVYADAIEANAITAAKIRANAITAIHLSANSVNANSIESNSITTALIRANAITAVQLAALSVYANAIQANAVTTDALAANAITSKHISANTITASMIDSRGLVIRNAAGSVLLGDGVLANTLIVYDNNGAAKTLAAVVTPSGETAIQFLGTFASTSAADAAGAGTNNVAKITNLNNNTYIKRASGTWELFLSNGDPGNAGTASFAALIYYNTSQVNSPGAPSGGSYNFSTNTLTPPTGWSTTPPVTGTDPTWATNYIFTGTTGTVTAGTWATPYVIAEKATDGKSVFGASIFIQQSSTPSAPSGGSFNFSTSTLTAPSGWSVDLPTASTTPTWIANFIFSTDTAGATVTAGTWINVRKFTQSGQDGNAGVRGNLRVAKIYSAGYPGVTWPVSFANEAITELVADAVVRIRDEVTLYNTSTGYSETRFWTGSAWSNIEAYINGGLVVNGTISANQIAAGAINSDKIQAGSISGDRLCAGAITTDKITSSGFDGSCICNSTASPAKLSSGSTTTINSLGCFALGSGTAMNGFQGTGLFNSTGNGAGVLGFNSSTSGTAAFAMGGVAREGNFGGVFANSGRSDFYGFHNIVSLGHDRYSALFRGLYNPTSYNNNGLGYFRSETYINGCGGVSPGIAGISAALFNASFGIASVNYQTSGSDSFGSPTGLSAVGQSSFVGAASGATVSFGAFGRLNNQGTNTERSKGFLAYDIYSVFGSTGKIYSTQGYAPFTGVHDGITNELDLVPGDIVIDHSVLKQIDISNAIVEIKKSTLPNQKNVIGVFTQYIDEIPDDWYVINEIPETEYHNTLLSGPVGENGETLETQIVPETNVVNNNSTKELIYNIPNGYKVLHINALGEGYINVCGENGNIEAGDLITTSSMPGKGMKQADDLLRNYTVAKARESVTFDSPTDVKQIAVTYHCG